MDRAYNTVDGHTWDAGDLGNRSKQEDPEWLRQRRPYFLCCGCEAPAVFVSAGTSNRVPHFRSGHDDEGCDYSAHGLNKADTPGAEDVEAVPEKFNDGGNKEIRYERPKPGGIGGHADGEGKGLEAVAQAGVAHILPGNDSRGSHETTGLRRLLAHLRNDPGYPPADLRFDVPDRGSAVLASEYLCRFEDATEAHTHAAAGGQAPLMAYWGVICRPVEGNGALFLNPGEADEGIMTVRLEPAATREFLKALGKNHLELTGWHLIVEGRLEQGRFSRFVRVSDITKLAVRPPLNTGIVKGTVSG
jgi:hypothetical protein